MHREKNGGLRRRWAVVLDLAVKLHRLAKARGVAWTVLLVPLSFAAPARGADEPPEEADNPPPSVALQWTYFPQAALEDSAGEVLGRAGVTSTLASLAYTHLFSLATRLELAVMYERLDFSYRQIETPMRVAHATSGSALLTHQLNESWGLLAIVAPGYAGDYRGKPTLEPLLLNLVAAGTYRLSDAGEVGLGVGVQSVFGRPLAIPVAKFDWAFSKRLFFESVIPLMARLTWLPVDFVGLRAGISARGNAYRGDPAVYGVAHPQMDYSAVTAEGAVRWFLLPWLHVTGRAGCTLYRAFEFSDRGQDLEGGKYNLRNGAVFGLDLGAGG